MIIQRVGHRTARWIAPVEDVCYRFGTDPQHKDRALLLDNTIFNPCISTNLENTARMAGEQLAGAVEHMRNKYWGSFPAAFPLLPLAMFMCDKLGSEVHAFINELAT